MMKRSPAKIVPSGSSAAEDRKRSGRKTVSVDYVYTDEGSDVTIVIISLIRKLWVGLTSSKE